MMIFFIQTFLADIMMMIMMMISRGMMIKMTLNFSLRLLEDHVPLQHIDILKITNKSSKLIKSNLFFLSRSQINELSAVWFSSGMRTFSV